MADWLNKKRQKWTDALKAKGHMPAMCEDDGQLDGFFLDTGTIHNGPGCAACGWSCCWHCDGIDAIPQCTVLELQATKMIEGA